MENADLLKLLLGMLGGGFGLKLLEVGGKFIESRFARSDKREDTVNALLSSQVATLTAKMELLERKNEDLEQKNDDCERRQHDLEIVNERMQGRVHELEAALERLQKERV